MSDRLTKERSTFIAGGWDSYRRMVLPADASEIQLRECRQAFYAGASVLFETIMVTLDPGTEPTASDMTRMDDIQAEVTAFGQELDKRAFGAQEH